MELDPFWGGCEVEGGVLVEEDAVHVPEGEVVGVPDKREADLLPRWKTLKH